MLKGWNVFLILLTFLMTYFGTFLTRSGIVQSVHAFGSGPVGPLLGGFVLSLILVCTYLVVIRHKELRAENEIEAVLSREATFLYNNVGLLGFMVMVFVGTMFPVFSEAVYEVSNGAIGNGKVVVGPPFFNPLAAIITIGLLVLMGIGQLVAWRKTSGGAVRRNFTVPLLVTGLSWVFFLVVLPKEQLASLPFRMANPWAVAVLVSSVFVIAGIVWEYWIGVRSVESSHRSEIASAWDAGHRFAPEFLIAAGITGSILGWAIASVWLATFGVWTRLLFGAAIGIASLSAAGALSGANRKAFDVMQAAVILFVRNRRRYGGYVTHLGITLAIVGICASSLYKIDETHIFTEGETKKMGEFDLTFKGLELRREPGMWRMIAYMRMDKNGEKFGVAYPEKRYHDKGDQPTTEVSIHESALRDYYLIMESATDKRMPGNPPNAPATVTIRLLQSPLVTWFWFGGVLLLGGTALAAWPERKRKEATVTVPVSGGVAVPEGAVAKEHP